MSTLANRTVGGNVAEMLIQPLKNADKGVQQYFLQNFNYEKTINEKNILSTKFTATNTFKSFTKRHCVFKNYFF